MVWRMQKPPTQPAAKAPTLDKNEMLESMHGDVGETLGAAELILDRFLIRESLQ